MERRLLAAERLIAGLGSEKERWGNDIKALEAAKEQLVGDCLLCSSFLSYTGEGTGPLTITVDQVAPVKELCGGGYLTSFASYCQDSARGCSTYAAP